MSCGSGPLVQDPPAPKNLSDLARAALHAAVDSASPRPPGPADLLIAIFKMRSHPGAEAEELSSLFRAAGWEALPVIRIDLAARSEEGLDAVFARAETSRRMEGAEAIGCRHFLLALAQRPVPQLLEQFAALRLRANDLFANTLTMKVPVRRRSSLQSGPRLIEYYRGRLLDDRYQVLDGAYGGMGCVLFCADRVAGRPVALKLCSDHASPQSLLDEARKWILLGYHPHIVRALYAGLIPPPPPLEPPIRYLAPSPWTPPPKAGPSGSTVYIALEMIHKSTRSGCSLRNWLNDTPRLPNTTILRWALQIASALEYAAGRHGLIHQDIKPDNILITPSGEAKLSDFGVSFQIGGRRAVGGTPVYMAPEHRAGRPSVQSDIYSFGITLAECFLEHIRPEYLALICDGAPGAFSQEQLATLFLHGRPEDESATAPLCNALARLVGACTAANPAQRLSDFGRLRSELAGLAQAHLGIDLNIAKPEMSRSLDLLNQGLALLWLRPGEQDISYAGDLLMQASLQAPNNPVLAIFSRSFVKRMKSREILRFAWRHARAGTHASLWWSWLLASVSAYGCLLYFSPEPLVAKVSDTLLALALGVEAYVNFLSGKNLNILAIGIGGLCAALYAVRWIWGRPFARRGTKSGLLSSPHLRSGAVSSAFCCLVRSARALHPLVRSAISP
jgi:serine/threonine protein kinase